MPPLNDPGLIWAAHLFLTWAMTGVIWHVQVVQYPLFRQVGRESFAAYHDGHCFRISFIVVPLILGEAATAAGLLYLGWRQPLFLGSLPFLALAWLSTALLQAPLHTRLMTEGAEPHLLNRLVRTNWLRTVAWSARALLLLGLHVRGI